LSGAGPWLILGIESGAGTAAIRDPLRVRVRVRVRVTVLVELEAEHVRG
jgi:hypothetical protein